MRKAERTWFTPIEFRFPFGRSTSLTGGYGSCTERSSWRGEYGLLIVGIVLQLVYFF